MCGIFGFSLKEAGSISPKHRLQLVRKLFLLSESRGKEACGLAAACGQRISVIKSNQAPSGFLKTKECLGFLNAEVCANNGGLDFIGHSRLVTNGSQQDHKNNQPVLAGNCVGVHNGIVVNDTALWQANPSLMRPSQLDSQIIFSLLRNEMASASDPIQAAAEVYKRIDGVASVAVLFKDLPGILLATNNGSLYYMADQSKGLMVFASEAWILEQLRRLAFLRFPKSAVCKVYPQQFVWWPTGPASKERTIKEYPSLTGNGGSYFTDDVPSSLVERLKNNHPHGTFWADSLRRCTRCILPETMPFIRFDAAGVCSFCQRYQKLELQGEDALRQAVEDFRPRRQPHKPDCVVAVSGGRDSLYALHYVKKVLGLNPVAYTYDWGMVTDLARRNISRVCSRLGVEHIIVSADIRRKRDYIRQNVLAWLKNPHLGTVPIFMAGDKQYFYYMKKVCRQVGGPLAIMGENMLERTDFKTGFAGVPPHKDSKHVQTLSLMGHAQLFAFYLRQYLSGCGYINGSLIDTVFAAASYYFLDRSYVNVYAYVPWDEQKIISLLRRDYDFELAADTTSSWRIGDGTAAFYNYIYFKVAGFTENDTFRSNQIREGKISREQALALVKEENKPRYQTIAWYLKTIDLDPEKTLEIIDRIPRLKGIIADNSNKKVLYAH